MRAGRGGCFYMWSAKDPTWGQLRMARLLLGQARSNLALPREGHYREDLPQELAEGNCLSALSCLLRAAELREQRRFWRRSLRWLRA